MTIWKPFRISIGKGTPIREMPSDPSNLPDISNDEITSITSLRNAIKQPSHKKVFEGGNDDV